VPGKISTAMRVIGWQNFGGEAANGCQNFDGKAGQRLSKFRRESGPTAGEISTGKRANGRQNFDGKAGHRLEMLAAQWYGIGST